MKLNVEDFSNKMIGLLPSFYLEEDNNQNHTLRKYLSSAFIGGAKDILNSINGVTNFIDPITCPSEDLPRLFESWGLTYEPTLDESYQRKLLSNIGEIYRRKGSYSCIKYLVRTITGYDCLINYTKIKGERRLGVLLIAKSFEDYSSSNIIKSTEVIEKVLPQFLPFYLNPWVAYTPPVYSLPFSEKHVGYRLSCYKRYSPQAGSNANIFRNHDFNMGSLFWIPINESAQLSPSSTTVMENKCLEYYQGESVKKGFFQDLTVKRGDRFTISASFMCPDLSIYKSVVVTARFSFYADNGCLLHQSIKEDIELSSKNRWSRLKRTIFVEDKFCNLVRVTFYTDNTNVPILFSMPKAESGTKYTSY